VTAPAPALRPVTGGGEPKSVIDGERRRLQCLRPDVGGARWQQGRQDTRTTKRRLEALWRPWARAL